MNRFANLKLVLAVALIASPLLAQQPVNVSLFGGNAVVTGGANGLVAVGGPVPSGSSNADNPVKVGGVFNTTQPTVTNGQVVDLQATARGAMIVATGTDTFTVTANAGTNLNTSLLALESGGNLAKIPLAQGSTTSGQSGPLVQGAVTTSAPSYTTAQTSPLSLDTSGNLRTTSSFAPSTGSSVALTGANLVESTSTYDVIKASAGNLYAVDVYNPNGTPCYLVFYNNATPTIGTTAKTYSFGVQAGVSKTIGPGAFALANFSTAIVAANTTTAGGASVCTTGMALNVMYQ